MNRFRPDNIDEAHNCLEESQTKSKKAMVKFKHSQDFAAKGYIQDTTLCNFLKSCPGPNQS